MSRIGKRAVAIPTGVTASVEGQTVKMKGPKGALEAVLPREVAVTMDKGGVKVDPRNETKRARSMWGTSRTLVANLVAGVTKGFERKLEINGVGYKAEVAGDKLNMSLGFSHPIAYPLPKGISAKVEKNILTLSGIDRELLGQTAAKVRSFRPPEPYKGKGVKYIEEYIKRKVGKTGAA